MGNLIRASVVGCLAVALLGCTTTEYSNSPTVVVREGGQIPNLHGPSVRVREISTEGIVLNDNWVVPAKPARHHIGNHDYLEIIVVNLPAKQLKARITSRVRASFRDAWGF